MTNAQITAENNKANRDAAMARIRARHAAKVAKIQAIQQATSPSDSVLASLRANVEGRMTRNGQEWGQVYLDNAKPDGMNRHQFAGYLSALTERGLYKAQGDDCFGDVLIG